MGCLCMPPSTIWGSSAAWACDVISRAWIPFQSVDNFYEFDMDKEKYNYLKITVFFSIQLIIHNMCIFGYDACNFLSQNICHLWKIINLISHFLFILFETEMFAGLFDERVCVGRKPISAWCCVEVKFVEVADQRKRMLPSDRNCRNEIHFWQRIANLPQLANKPLYITRGDNVFHRRARAIQVF